MLKQTKQNAVWSRDGALVSWGKVLEKDLCPSRPLSERRAAPGPSLRGQLSPLTWLRPGSGAAPLTLRLFHRWPLARSQWQKEVCCPSAFPGSEACRALQAWDTAFTRGLLQSRQGQAGQSSWSQRSRGLSPPCHCDAWLTGSPPHSTSFAQAGRSQPWRPRWYGRYVPVSAVTMDLGHQTHENPSLLHSPRCLVVLEAP